MASNTRLKKITITGETLAQGFFADRASMDIPAGGCEDCNNIISLNGKLRPRAGLQKYIATKPDSNPVYSISRDAQGFLMRISYTGGSQFNIHRYNGTTWSLIGQLPVVDIQARPQTAVFGKVWMATNGQTVPANTSYLSYVVWDGSTFYGAGVGSAYFTSPPPGVARFISTTESRVFLASCGGSGYRVAWCDRVNPKVWRDSIQQGTGSSSYTDLPSNNQPITGMWAAPNSSLMVFKNRETYFGRFTEAPKFYDFSLISKNIGCPYQDTLKDWVQNQVFWLGNDNVYVAVPSGYPQPIANQIRPYLQDLVDTNPSGTWLDAVGSIDNINGLYTLFLPNGANNGKKNLFVTLNANQGTWWKGLLPDSFDITCSYEFLPNQPWKQFSLLGTFDGEIYDMDPAYNGDNGAAFPVYWRSGVISYRKLTKGETDQGSLQQIRGSAVNGTLQMGVYWGDGLDRFQFTDFGTQQFDGVSSLAVSERAESENFKLQFNGDSMNFPRIEAMEIGFILKGVTR